MDEPKRYDAVDGDGYHAWQCVETEDGDFYKVDDPAIVQALAVRKACHEAGLLDEHGNLRKPHCWWTADGEAIPCPTEDLDCNGSPGDVCKVRPAWGGKWEWWALDSDEDAIGPFDNSEAAERAAKGGTDGH